MGEIFGVEADVFGGLGEGGVDRFGGFFGEGGECAKSFDLSECFKPRADFGTDAMLPSFEASQAVEIPKEDGVEREVDQAGVTDVTHINDLLKAGHLFVGSGSLGAKLLLKGVKRGVFFGLFLIDHGEQRSVEQEDFFSHGDAREDGDDVSTDTVSK